MKVSYGNGSVKFNISPGSDFTKIPLPGEPILSLDSTPLKEAILMVLPFKANPDEWSAAYSCVNLQMINKDLMAVAIMKGGSAAATYKIEADPIENPIMLMPDMASHIMEIKDNDTVVFSEDERFLHLSCGNVLISEVKFSTRFSTNVEKLFSTPHASTTTINAAELCASIKRLIWAAPSFEATNPAAKSITLKQGDGSMVIVQNEYGSETISSEGDDLPEMTFAADILLKMKNTGSLSILHGTPVLENSAGGTKFYPIKFQSDDFLALAGQTAKAE